MENSELTTITECNGCSKPDLNQSFNSLVCRLLVGLMDPNLCLLFRGHLPSELFSKVFFYSDIFWQIRQEKSKQVSPLMTTSSITISSWQECKPGALFSRIYKWLLQADMSAVFGGLVTFCLVFLETIK